jgi:drug/metabolite transporter (DMT)-like permease
MLLSIGLACIAVLGFGSAAIFARLGMQALSPMPGTLISLVASTLLAGALALTFNFSEIVALPAIAMVWLLGNGILTYMGGRTQQYIAIIGSATLFTAMYAIVFTRIGVPGFDEHLTVLIGIGTLVVVFGLTLTGGNFLRHSWGRDWRSVMGYGLALMSASCYGASTLSGKVLSNLFGSPLIMAAGSMFFAMVVLSPWFGRQAAEGASQTRKPAFFMFLAGLTAACAVMSIYFAITREGSSVLVISPIVSCNPLVTLVLARLFLQRTETVSRELVFGTLLAVGGVSLVVIGGLI